MRTSLTSQQWKRLRAYVNGLTEEQRKRELHRCIEWEDSMQKELSAISDGLSPRDFKACQPVSKESVTQVANWLRKA